MTSKNLNKSRLKEVNFSNYNLRDAYITDMPEYYSFLRDEVIFSNYGIKVLVRVPADDNFEVFDNNVDEYSNFVTEHWIDTVECVVPKFLEYRQNVDVYGMSADGTDGLYPLEVAIPAKLHLPKDSRIVFSEYDSNENQIVREWTVLSTQMKQLSGSKTYTRVAMCVPARKESYKTFNTAEVTLWFDCYKPIVHKLDAIRAQGTIWFNNSLTVDNDLIRVLAKRDIQEVPDSDYIFISKFKDLVYYDNRPKTIIDGGFGFAIDETFLIRDKNDNIIYITIDEEGTQIPLTLTVTEVDKIGKILAYDLNVSQGYTLFGTEGTLAVEIQNNYGLIATIELTSIEYSDEAVQETLESQYIKTAKFVTPYEINIRISGKKLAISVLD